MTCTYDLNNRLTESIEVNGEITTTEQYFYDNNGNQISKVVSATHPSDIMGEGDYSVSDVTDNYVALYEYNCYNQLVYANTDGVISTYTYAPDGLRNKKTVGDVVTMFVYDNANIIEEIVGADTNKYYRGIGIIKNGDGLYYLYNGQGDVAMLTNADGEVVASYTFDAYGNAQQENTVYNPFGYRGEYADSETGFIYLRARYYDPTTGRFINEDPIRDGLNWYVYCENNPIVFVDPWGLEVATDYEEFAEQGYRDVYLRLAKLGAAWRETNDDNYRNELHAEAELLRALARIHMRRNEFTMINTVEALRKVLRNNNNIYDASELTKVPKEMIASELYKEYLYRDPLDFRIAESVLFKFRGDASFGIGQVRTDTAIKAENAFYEYHKLSTPNRSKSTMKKLLQNETTNIKYVAIVLWHCGYTLDPQIDITQNYDFFNVDKVFQQYNPYSKGYGAEVSEFVAPFWDYYKAVGK